MSPTSTCGASIGCDTIAPGRARGERPLDEFMAVVDRPRHGDEQVARLHLAAVEGDPGNLEIAVARAAGRRGDFGGGPQRASCRALAGDDDVVERQHRGRSDDLALLMALAGDAARCPLPAPLRSPRQSLRGGRRSRSRPGAPASTSRRILAGSSPRGLSSVTITRSDSRAATAPISGRLPWSRSPPAPNTVISRPPRHRRRAAAAPRSPPRARRRCGRNRHRPARRPRLITARSSRPRTGDTRCIAEKAASNGVPVAITSPAATSTLAAW